MTYPKDDVLLAARIKALAHPARLAIVRALMQRDGCCCGEIVEVLPLAQSTVSQHLKILRKAGLIRGEVSGPKSCYCLDREALAAVTEEMERLGLPLASSDRPNPSPGPVGPTSPYGRGEGSAADLAKPREPVP